MASSKPSSRYSSFDSRSSTSSHLSDPSSSLELKNPTKNLSTFKRLIGSSSSSRRRSPDPILDPKNYSRILARTQSANPTPGTVKTDQNFGSMVKKFMEKRSKPRSGSHPTTLIIPADFLAEDLKKSSGAAKGSNLSAFHRKLFRTGKDRPEAKALTEVKANTRTLAMVLRSERDLLSQNTEYEVEIAELRLMLEEKNREAEKLKDLCLKQREEIKSLKSAILFPDVMNAQLHELLEQQGSELKQAKQVIPTLQKQVTSLTGQLQCLAVDLAEVKADKYTGKACYEEHISSPRTPEYDQEAANSLEFSSGDPMTPGGSLDDMFLKDLNPCLTPYYSNKIKSREYEEMLRFDSISEEVLFGKNTQVSQEKCSSSHGGKLSKSSEYCQRTMNSGIVTARVVRRSDENKCTSTNQRLF